jgi:hypothetical protein
MIPRPATCLLLICLNLALVFAQTSSSPYSYAVPINIPSSFSASALTNPTAPVAPLFTGNACPAVEFRSELSGFVRFVLPVFFFFFFFFFDVFLSLPSLLSLSSRDRSNRLDFIAIRATRPELTLLSVETVDLHYRIGSTDQVNVRLTKDTANPLKHSALGITVSQGQSISYYFTYTSRLTSTVATTGSATSTSANDIQIACDSQVFTLGGSTQDQQTQQQQQQPLQTPPTSLPASLPTLAVSGPVCPSLVFENSVTPVSDGFVLFFFSFLFVSVSVGLPLLSCPLPFSNLDPFFLFFFLLSFPFRSFPLLRLYKLTFKGLSAANAQLTLQTIEYVDLHYSINNQPDINVRMVRSSGLVYEFASLPLPQTTDSLSYYITYAAVLNGIRVACDTQRYTFLRSNPSAASAPSVPSLPASTTTPTTPPSPLQTPQQPSTYSPSSLSTPPTLPSTSTTTTSPLTNPTTSLPTSSSISIPRQPVISSPSSLTCPALNFDQRVESLSNL